MKIVGLTGGIGSGKTMVAKEFAALGIPVYITDEEAKKLMRKSKVIKRKLIELFGEQAYIKNDLNRPFLADAIFNERAYLEKMNAIVHPRVAKHFNKWMLKQNAPYIIKEAAILFENGSYKQCDIIVTVTAPKALRIERLLHRDNTTLEKIEAIMSNQWNDEQRIKLSNYVIENVTLENTKKQVRDIHMKILKKVQ